MEKERKNAFCQAGSGIPDSSFLLSILLTKIAVHDGCGTSTSRSNDPRGPGPRPRPTTTTSKLHVHDSQAGQSHMSHSECGGKCQLITHNSKIRKETMSPNFPTLGASSASYPTSDHLPMLVVSEAKRPILGIIIYDRAGGEEVEHSNP